MSVKEVKTFWLYKKEKVAAQGCVLPDGQVAMAWLDTPTHGCYPSLVAFEEKQLKMGRKIAFGHHFMDGYYLNTFKLVRHKDVSGISGTGIVAVGCCFDSCLGHPCVMQWLSDRPSTFWYPDVATIKQIHGHQGKTTIEVDTSSS
ncbi:MAG: hypothetical protein SAK29_01145 [Scytonema sp. PMC 1069.18]|nr:hypothetical protein [Scytonema sp. PMC 1069.18]